MSTERIKAAKKTSYIYKKTSRHALGLAFSKLKEYEKFTRTYSEKSEEELSLVQEQVNALRKKMDEINFKTIQTEAPQTAIDLLAGMRRVDPTEDYFTLAEMAVTYHLYRVSSSYIPQDKTPMSWWFGSFKTILAESVNTGRGYQKNHMSNNSYKVCVTAWEKAKESVDFKAMNDYATDEALFPVKDFVNSLASMIKDSYQSTGSSLTHEDYDFTLIARK
jgi:hypothetical protein